ncbi:hypothetical protein F511_04860 [Dorcoceras hygrometricum]|uniref:Dystroglycan-like n=1 Tax=Dorcoceras hygrometricum TaxID=472368 RepID=A0A2Z7DI60_9LAMI|nr:hypothetical protein F511_04860 [Dorcoceras hygrometricum]
MASLLIDNAIQIYFDSVYGMADEGMVQMFKALESSGLRGFLGCSSAIYEAALVEFFQNASLRENKVVSAVQGKAVEISEEVFAGTFEFLTEGFTEMNDVPKDLVFDARSAFSMGGEQLKTSCKKMEMKFEFRLLNDILAKTVTVKAGYFDAVTHERFLMMSAIRGGVMVNWGRLLFNIFKDMVTPTSKQARGFAVQICIILKGAPDLELGESKEFPPLKILTAKTVGTYVAKNKNIDFEEVVDEPVVKKAAPKRRPSLAVGELVAKKKGTTVGREAPVEKELAMVPVVQDPVPISVIPAVTPRAPRRRARKRKLVLQEGSDDEIVDNIIHQVIAETAEIEIGEQDSEEPVVMETTKTAAVETEKEKEIELVADEGMSLGKITDSEDTEPLSKVLELTEKSTSDEESTSIDDILAQIPEDMMLPSTTAAEPTRIKFVLGIEINGVQEGDWYKASLPQIDVADKGKEPLEEPDTVKGHPARDMFSLFCADIDFLVQLREKVIEEIVSLFQFAQLSSVGISFRYRLKGGTNFSMGRNRFSSDSYSEADAAVDRHSGPRLETIFLQSACTRKLMDFSTDGNSSSRCPEKVRRGAAARDKRRGREVERSTCVTLNGSGIQLAVGPQSLWLRNHNFGLPQRIMVKRLATSRHDPLGITDSACKNQLVMVSVHYGPFNTYIPIRSATIDIIGYPRMRASGESSTTKHRLLHASGSHPIPPPNEPKTNQYNQDLGLIHSTNGNHLESPNEGSSIDHQVTIHLHSQNITMFPTNETWYFTSQMLVSSSGGLILILTAQSTRNEFRIHIQVQIFQPPIVKTWGWARVWKNISDDLPAISPSADIPQIGETTADIPKISIPTAVISSINYTESFAHLRATIDKIHLKQVRTLKDIDDLKAVLTSRMSRLETSVQNVSTHHENIFRHLIRAVQQEVKTMKDDSTVFRQETQTGIATLNTQLSEIVAYLNRGRDDKKG